MLSFVFRCFHGLLCCRVCNRRIRDRIRLCLQQRDNKRRGEETRREENCRELCWTLVCWSLAPFNPPWLRVLIRRYWEQHLLRSSSQRWLIWMDSKRQRCRWWSRLKELRHWRLFSNMVWLLRPIRVPVWGITSLRRPWRRYWKSIGTCWELWLEVLLIVNSGNGISAPVAGYTSLQTRDGFL